MSQSTRQGIPIPGLGGYESWPPPTRAAAGHPEKAPRWCRRLARVSLVLGIVALVGVMAYMGSYLRGGVFGSRDADNELVLLLCGPGVLMAHTALHRLLRQPHTRTVTVAITSLVMNYALLTAFVVYPVIALTFRSGRM